MNSTFARVLTTITFSALLSVPLLATAASVYVGPEGVGYSNNSGSTQIFLGSGQGGMPFVCNGNTICRVASTFLYIINYVLVPLLFAVAFIVFLYGVATKYIFSHGDKGKVEEGHKLILWGLVGFAVMVSLWGLVNVVINTFGLAGYRAPLPPTSY